MRPYNFAFLVCAMILLAILIAYSFFALMIIMIVGWGVLACVFILRILIGFGVLLKRIVSPRPRWKTSPPRSK